MVDDRRTRPPEPGVEIVAQPPGKKLAVREPPLRRRRRR